MGSTYREPSSGSETTKRSEQKSTKGSARGSGSEGSTPEGPATGSAIDKGSAIEASSKKSARGAGPTASDTGSDASEAMPRPVQPVGRSLVAAGLAWLLPGAGHAVLGRWRRGLVFFILVLAFALLGYGLDGRLYTFETAQRLLHYVAAMGAFGLGLPYFVLHHVMGYQGDPAAASYEYGTAFLITASLLNFLLVLDVWDIARGWKE